MKMIRSFEDLRSWQEGHQLVLLIYQLALKFPSEEKFGLTSQLRRSAASIPANIAEGMGRSTTKDLIRFLINARGSTQEVIYHLLLAKDLGYISLTDYDQISSRYRGLNAGINAHIKMLRSQDF